MPSTSGCILGSLRQRILVYEYLSSGGAAGGELPARWLREGWAMFHAVATDLAAIEGVEVTAMVDARLCDRSLSAQHVVLIDDTDEERRWLCERSADFDGVLLIAPETDGLLYDRCVRVEQAGGRLLGPSSSAVRLAGDKCALNRHLAHYGIPVPRSWAIDRSGKMPADAVFPAVLKPRFGAGSSGIVLVRDASEWDLAWRRHCNDHAALTPDAPYHFDMPSAAPERGADGSRPSFQYPSVLEEFVVGTHASVAVMVGPRCIAALIPCRQILSEDGGFQYLGGRLPLDCNTATVLAEEVVRAIPGLRGYVGVDFVVRTDDGADTESATVIELNPRLTTSYVGLRRAVVGNLADMMLRCICGEMPRLRFHDRIIEFDADGAVRLLGEPASKG